MKVPADFGVDDTELTEVVVRSDLHSAKQPEGQIINEMLRQGYDADAAFGLKLALEEAMTNAVKHGNCNDPNKTIVVRYFVGPQRVVVMVRDEGCGFCPDVLPDPTTDDNLERPNGRGIMLMQSYMTRVCFNEAGNEVWMLKQRQEASP
jgi:serine/threonine-protein kinase RsbW